MAVYQWLDMKTNIGGIRAMAQRAAAHLNGLSADPANLCSLSCGVEFAGFGEDFGQSIGELIKAVSGRAVLQRATERPGCRQCDV
jgi:hypothetical protein